MDLELHQLDLRYAALRSRSPRREKQLIASLAEVGQQMPIVVIAADVDERFIVIDGHKRVRAVERLKRDLVRATLWQLGHAEALLLERLMRTNDSDSPLEQGWLLSELKLGCGLSLEELARRFDRSKSWVSRRLALALELPDFVQERVRNGEIAPQAAMKYLVLLARANAQDCQKLLERTAGARLSVRQLGALYAGYKSGGQEARRRLLEEPELFLRAHEAAAKARAEAEPSPEQLLLQEAGTLGGIARRTARHLLAGLGRTLDTERRVLVGRAFSQAKIDSEALFALAHKELADARPEHPHGNSSPA